MTPLNISDVIVYVEDNIGDFHKRRLESLGSLKLNKILRRKNPYLFKAKNVLTAHELVKNLLDAHLSSQEEGIFGEFLEGLAVFVCKMVYGGRKSPAEGIDLEFEKEGIIYIISIKSGPNWGNSGQIKRMADNFKKAQKILRTSSGSRTQVIAINGCPYGRDVRPDKGDYLKLCGQDFWMLISGNENLYVEIIEPLGYHAKERNEEFLKEYARILNVFTQEFTNAYCMDGIIDWERLLKFNSGNKLS
jgi:hypothetical protein